MQVGRPRECHLGKQTLHRHKAARIWKKRAVGGQSLQANENLQKDTQFPLNYRSFKSTRLSMILCVRPSGQSWRVISGLKSMVPTGIYSIPSILRFQMLAATTIVDLWLGVAA